MTFHGTKTPKQNQFDIPKELKGDATAPPFRKFYIKEIKERL